MTAEPRENVQVNDTVTYKFTNTKAEVIQAFEDYQAGRLGSVPAAHETLN
ncbi:hypothetical protein GS425_14125 [Rhodococcus hoagii]|nr:hypothetical protein [Prescottella equi]